MAYFTENQARIAANNIYASFAEQSLRESVNKAKSYDRFDIFLSHSSKDAVLILGVKKLLENQGYTVYVDWLVDTQLSRENVNKGTADILRSRMKQSKSLIYVATKNATNSKWMPWELGFFDGFKSEAIAILPLTENENDTYDGQEYLSLYPLVTKDKYSNGQSDVFVEDKPTQWKSLRDFVNSSTAWKSYGRA